MVSQALLPNTEQPSNFSKTREASDLLCDISPAALGTPQCPVRQSSRRWGFNVKNQLKLNTSASVACEGGLDGGLLPFCPSARGLKCCREKNMLMQDLTPTAQSTHMHLHVPAT